MNHEILKTVIYDHHNIIKNFSIVERDYTFEKNANYVLVGLRRAGKSTLLYKVVQDLIKGGVDWEQIIYINFEDDRLAEFSLSDFDDICQVQSELSDKKGYYFFVEIQNIDGWEKFARRLADAKEFVYITGSDAKMLGKEMEAMLGGRYLSKLIYTYSFQEYLTVQKIKSDSHALLSTRQAGRIRQSFDTYLHFGGFPEALQFQAKREYISNVYQKILLGDIVFRNNIRNEYALKILIKKIAETVCNEISYSRLRNILKTVGVSASKDTLIDYVAYAKDAYLLFTVHNYFAKFAQKEGNPKYYFYDNGLLNLFLHNNDTALLENVIAIYLWQRYAGDVHYLKSSKTGIDVDFFIPETGLALQVAYSIEGEAREREVGNLLKLSKTFDEAKRFVIITKEEKGVIAAGDIEIQVIPAYIFLLGES